MALLERKWLNTAHKALDNVATDDNYWSQIAEVYSRRQLTQYTDKFSALSGIASAISAVGAGDVYLEGLWNNSRPFDLTWRTQLDKWVDSNLTKPPGYRPPSLSWASVDMAPLNPGIT
jgi:hypothetical protein